MGTVWVRGQGDVLVRADSIIVLAIVHGGLSAECAGGGTVGLAGSECPGALQMGLLDEIRRASADDRHAVVIMPPTEQDSATWRRECADTLLELQAAHESRLSASPGGGHPHAVRLVDPAAASACSRTDNSRVNRLAERPPLLAEILDDLACLRMADLDELVIEVAALPLHDDRGEAPAEIATKAFVGETVAVEFQAA